MVQPGKAASLHANKTVMIRSRKDVWRNLNAYHQVKEASVNGYIPSDSSSRTSGKVKLWRQSEERLPGVRGKEEHGGS